MASTLTAPPDLASADLKKGRDKLKTESRDDLLRTKAVAALAEGGAPSAPASPPAPASSKYTPAAAAEMEVLELPLSNWQ